jgi:hypothetical protein
MPWTRFVALWCTAVSFWSCRDVVVARPVAAFAEDDVQAEEGGNDFDALNALLQGAVVRLPDARVVSQDAMLELNLQNIQCTNFTLAHVGLTADAVIPSSPTGAPPDDASTTTTRVAITMEGLDMICHLDYTYTFLFTRQGSATLSSYGNQAFLTMDVLQRQSRTERNNSTITPTTTTTTVARVQDCRPTVQISDLEFRGDIAAIVLNTVERWMRQTIAEAARARLCEELRALSTTLVADFLDQTDEALAVLAKVEIDPLRAEQDLLRQQQLQGHEERVNLLDLRDESRATSQWLDKILAYAADFANQAVLDRSGALDTNINVFIREKLMEDGALVLDANGVEVFANHNQFLDTTILVDRVRIFGLDQLESFEPLLEVGSYTLQNKLSWSLLTVEMGMTIDIRASTKPGSVFLSPNGEGTQESIKITFGIRNLKVILSILLAVDEDILGALPLGSLLHSDKILACLLSTVYDARISGLSLEAADIQPPVMEGFVSRGIDLITSESVDAAFLVYESALLTAAPGFFHSTVRDFVNEILVDYVQGDVTCFIPADIGVSPTGFTDFRDLLLPSEQARLAGGSGTEPYGDLPFRLVSQLKEQFLTNDEYGAPRINTFIRETLGETIDGTDAVVELGDILKWNTTLAVAGLDVVLGVQILDARVGNLDSFGSPRELFEPVIGEGNMLNNSVSIGMGSKPLRLTARVLVTATDYCKLEIVACTSDSTGHVSHIAHVHRGTDGLQLNNEVTIRLDLGGAKLATILLLQILEGPFFSVPIEDTLNIYCWLTTILPSSADADLLLLANHSFSLDQLLLNITCVSCTSPDFSDLVYRLYSPEEVGNASSKVLNILSLVRESDFLRVTTDTVFGGASKQCPHHAKYDPAFSYGEYFVDSVGQGVSQESSVRDGKVMYFNVANAVLSVVMALAFYGMKSVARRRYHVWRDTLPDETFARLCLREDHERQKDDDLNLRTQALFHSRQVPGRVRILVPVALVATVGIQLVGHLAVLFRVNIEGQIAGESFTIHDFLTFKFIEASLRTYRNGGNEMSILLFVFTGVWPYLKLFTCLSLWFVPPSWISVTRRGTLLLWLDVFAKLSIVDILTTLLAVAAFLVYIGGVAERDLSTGQFFATRIMTVPCAGCYCIVIAQRLTRLSSTYLLDWHNQIVDDEIERRRLYDEIKQLEAALKTYSARTLSTVEASEDSFTLSPDRTLRKKRQSMHSQEKSSELAAPFESNTSFGTSSIESSLGGETECVAKGVLDTEVNENSFWRRLATAMTGCTVLALAVIGCIMAPSMSVDAKSLWGIFESGHTFAEVVTDYSLFRVICSILVQARFVLDSTKAKAGLGILLTLTVVTATAVPITKVVSSMRKWYQDRQAARETTKLENTEQRIASHNDKFPTWCRNVHVATLVWLQRLRSLVQRRRGSNKDDHCGVQTSWRSRLSRLQGLPVCLWRGFTVTVLWCKRLTASLRQRLHWTRDGAYEPSDDYDVDLLPAYKWKAWRHLEVYVLAFVVAIWQLGAVAVYVIQQYCALLEMCFDMLVFLGLVENTSNNCFREQASSASTLVILCAAFLALLASFLWEAIGQYRKVVASAEKEAPNDCVREVLLSKMIY